MLLFNRLLSPTIVLSVVMTLILFLVLPTPQFAAQSIEKLKLSGGTVVALSLEKAINSDMAEGSSVDLRLIRDVMVGDKVVIKSGSIATGTVTDVNSSGALGKAGKVSLKLRSVAAVDGQQVFLRGNVDKQGEDKVVMTVILGLLCLPLFLINGGDASVPAGTEVRAYVEQDYMIEVP